MRMSIKLGLWSMFFAPIISTGIALGHGSGFVWGDQPTSSRYTPDMLYSYVFGTNGAGSVEITRESTGTYRVEFSGIIDESNSNGHVQVTPYGDTHHCQVQRWQTQSTKLTAYVNCYDKSGALKDGRYTAMVTTPFNNDRSTLFAWANNPSAANYEPDSNYSHNSAGAVNITHSSTGSYLVRFSGAVPLMHGGGNVQVSGYGPQYGHCKVVNWSPSGSDLVVHVNCYDVVGSLADRRFTTYVSWGSTYPLFSSYTWGSLPTADRYAPAEQYSSRLTTIRRLGVGSYQVSFSGTDTYQSDAYQTNIQVTSYGATNNLCRVQYWQRANPRVPDDKMEVHINCYSPSGVPVDQQYSVLAFYPYVIP